jgi:ubiquitin-conjugating enzyme E2 R
LEFDKNFPIIPPQIKFNPPVFHPNIYRDGRVCISILHSPGDEEVSGEMPSERWTPIQSVQSILWSVLVLLDQANCDSPANVEAGVMFRTRMASYRARVQAEVTASVERKPWGIVLATAEDEGRGTETTCLEDEEVFIDQSGDIVMLDVP